MTFFSLAIQHQPGTAVSRVTNSQTDPLSSLYRGPACLTLTLFLRHLCLQLPSLEDILLCLASSVPALLIKLVAK